VKRILARLFGLNRDASGFGGAPWRAHAKHPQLSEDILAEYLRGTNHSDVSPEVLMRIL
jgi:hypothetical protein